MCSVHSTGNDLDLQLGPEMEGGGHYYSTEPLICLEIVSELSQIVGHPANVEDLLGVEKEPTHGYWPLNTDGFVCFLLSIVYKCLFIAFGFMKYLLGFLSFFL